MMVKRISVMDTKLEPRENPEVSVKFLCQESMILNIDASLGEVHLGNLFIPEVDLRITEAHLEGILRKMGVGDRLA